MMREHDTPTSNDDDTVEHHTKFYTATKVRTVHTFAAGTLRGYAEYCHDVQTIQHNYDHNGLHHGVQQYWYTDGVLAYECNCVHGAYEGAVHRAWPDGSQQYTGQYIDNVRDGTWRYWYPNGVLRHTEHYTGGVLDGVSNFWYDDGTIMRTVHNAFKIE